MNNITVSFYDKKWIFIAIATSTFVRESCNAVQTLLDRTLWDTTLQAMMTEPGLSLDWHVSYFVIQTTFFSWPCSTEFRWETRHVYQCFNTASTHTRTYIHTYTHTRKHTHLNKVLLAITIRVNFTKRHLPLLHQHKTICTCLCAAIFASFHLIFASDR